MSITIMKVVLRTTPPKQMKPQIFLQLLMVVVFLRVSTQHKYHIKFERAEVTYFNKKYYSDFYLDTKLVNRTYRNLKLGFTLVAPLDETAKLYIGAAKFVSNEYRQGAIQFTGTSAVFFKQKTIRDVLNKYCKPEIYWPLKVYVAYKCDSFMPTGADFNVYFPSGRWKLNVTQSLGVEKMYELYYYAGVEEVFS